MTIVDQTLKPSIIRRPSGWAIKFYDRKLQRCSYIRLGTKQRADALKRFHWWKRDDEPTTTVHLPILGLSVIRVLGDYLRAPFVKKSMSIRRESERILALARFFQMMALQEINDEVCRKYAKSRLAALVGKSQAEIALRRAHRRIRGELEYLWRAACHAHQWRRITYDEMPKIAVPLAERRLTIDELRGPFQWDPWRRKPPQTALAFVRQLILKHEILAIRRSERNAVEFDEAECATATQRPEHLLAPKI